MESNLENTAQTLERAKRIKQNAGKDIEYWMARDIQKLLGYSSSWQNFVNVIEKAKQSCETSGKHARNHFNETINMVEIGSGAKRKQQDFFLTRYACYLIAMNGDTTKPEIGIAQAYFAIQTRKQEIHESLTDDERRILQRERVKDANRKLAGIAKASGVKRYPLFQDAGYRGLYGMGLKDIKKRKGIEAKDELLDRAGRAELAANEFRITQTEAKLLRDSMVGEERAMYTHHQVGEEVRTTINKIGGTMPENLPPEPPIKELKKRQRQLKKERQKELN